MNKKGCEKNNKIKSYVLTLPYIQNVTEKIESFQNTIGSKLLLNLLQKLGQILTRVKDRIPEEKQMGVVYSIPCTDCPASC